MESIQDEPKKRGRKKKNLPPPNHVLQTSIKFEKGSASDQEHIKEILKSDRPVRQMNISFGGLEISVQSLPESTESVQFEKDCEVQNGIDYQKPIENPNRLIGENVKANSNNEKNSNSTQNNVENPVQSNQDDTWFRKIRHSNEQETQSIVHYDYFRYKQVKNPESEVVNKTGNWESTSPYACWWCCEHFQTQPFYTVCNYCPKTERFWLTGNFCTPGCAKAYETYEMPQKYHGLTNLLLMRLGYEVSKIPMSPPRISLKKFGGYLDIEEFRKPIPTRSFIVHPPWINIIQPIIKEVHKVVQVEQTPKFQKTTFGGTTSQTYRLARKKAKKSDSDLTNIFSVN